MATPRLFGDTEMVRTTKRKDYLCSMPFIGMCLTSSIDTICFRLSRPNEPRSSTYSSLLVTSALSQEHIKHPIQDDIFKNDLLYYYFMCFLFRFNVVTFLKRCICFDMALVVLSGVRQGDLARISSSLQREKVYFKSSFSTYADLVRSFCSSHISHFG
jgi:hypothetical protein